MHTKDHGRDIVEKLVERKDEIVDRALVYAEVLALLDDASAQANDESDGILEDAPGNKRFMTPSKMY